MIPEKRDFNKEAAAWDEKPERIKMAKSIFATLTGNLKFSKDMDVMDFGCGTGLISMQILPLVHTVTGADSSTGMLEVFNSKIAEQNLSRIKTLHIDIEAGEKLSGSYDVVTSVMTMHHIKELSPLFKQFYEIIKPGGCLCIADLDSDEGKFHDNNAGISHNGFPREEMKSLFVNAGFKEIADVTAFEISKPDKDGVMNDFSIFLMTGRKQ